LTCIMPPDKRSQIVRQSFVAYPRKKQTALSGASDVVVWPGSRRANGAVAIVT
jgi:hypothetical protein